jgi:hypothetical protein
MYDRRALSEALAHSNAPETVREDISSFIEWHLRKT